MSQNSHENISESASANQSNYASNTYNWSQQYPTADQQAYYYEYYKQYYSYYGYDYAAYYQQATGSSGPPAPPLPPPSTSAPQPPPPPPSESPMPLEPQPPGVASSPSAPMEFHPSKPPPGYGGGSHLTPQPQTIDYSHGLRPPSATTPSTPLMNNSPGTPRTTPGGIQPAGRRFTGRRSGPLPTGVIQPRDRVSRWDQPSDSTTNTPIGGGGGMQQQQHMNNKQSIEYYEPPPQTSTPSSTSGLGGQKFSPIIEDYIQRAFKSVPKSRQDEMQKLLGQKLRDLNSRGLLHSINWRDETLPVLPGTPAAANNVHFGDRKPISLGSKLLTSPIQLQPNFSTGVHRPSGPYNNSWCSSSSTESLAGLVKRQRTSSPSFVAVSTTSNVLLTATTIPTMSSSSYNNNSNIYLKSHENVSGVALPSSTTSPPTTTTTLLSDINDSRNIGKFDRSTKNTKIKSRSNYRHSGANNNNSSSASHSSSVSASGSVTPSAYRNASSSNRHRHHRSSRRRRHHSSASMSIASSSSSSASYTSSQYSDHHHKYRSSSPPPPTFRARESRDHPTDTNNFLANRGGKGKKGAAGGRGRGGRGRGKQKGFVGTAVGGTTNAATPSSEPTSHHQLQRRAERFRSHLQQGGNNSSFGMDDSSNFDLKRTLAMTAGNDTLTEEELKALWENMKIVGTSTQLEKRYLRLTQAPDPSDVRPPEILQQSLIVVLQKWKESDHSREEYHRVNEQLKSIRQDLTVQCIRDAFTMRVYEENVYVALEGGDHEEYNQCQSMLKALHEEKHIAGRDYLEFVAYRLLYYLLMKDTLNINITLGQLNAKARQHECIAFALKVRQSCFLNDYQAFFRLFHSAPRYCGHLMKWFRQRIQTSALKTILFAYRPTVTTEFLLREIDIEDWDEFVTFFTTVVGEVPDDKEKLDCKKFCTLLQQPKNVGDKKSAH